MSQENVEIVRRGLEYFLRTDEHLWETELADLVRESVDRAAQRSSLPTAA